MQSFNEIYIDLTAQVDLTAQELARVYRVRG